MHCQDNEFNQKSDDLINSFIGKKSECIKNDLEKKPNRQKIIQSDEILNLVIDIQILSIDDLIKKY